MAYVLTSIYRYVLRMIGNQLALLLFALVIMIYEVVPNDCELWQRPSIRSSNKAAQTGYAYSSGNTRNVMVKYTAYTDMEWQ